MNTRMMFAWVVAGIGDQYMGPIGLFVLWGHFFDDTSFSLCADIVTMPWQIARYMRFTSDDADASRSAMVPELLRYLNIGENYLNIGENQHRLVSTALTVLALLHHVTCLVAKRSLVRCANGESSISFRALIKAERLSG